MNQFWVSKWAFFKLLCCVVRAQHQDRVDEKDTHDLSVVTDWNELLIVEGWQLPLALFHVEPELVGPVKVRIVIAPDRIDWQVFNVWSLEQRQHFLKLVNCR